jgi:membrane protein DedA with SNARE-associated domain/uncharacterized membrane protein YkvA (DUF1232 family)
MAFRRRRARAGASVFDWITTVISEGGYLGIVFLMLAENVFPPIPSELIMPLAGFVAASGELNPALVVLAGTFGSMLGALPWYYAGRWLGEERMCRFAAAHGRWLTLDEKDVGKAIRWFGRRGRVAVLLGRLVPTVRTLISVPAGIARMPLATFLLWSAIGTAIWTGLLTACGFLLEESYTIVGDYLDQASKIILGLIVLAYLWRLISRGRLGERVRGFARTMQRDVYAMYLAARDPRVPWYAKAFALLVAAYAVSPVDLIPDFIPVLGHLDDLVLVPLGIYIAARLIPAELLEEHRRRAADLAKAPVDWRIGGLIIALWAIAAAFLIRFGLEYLLGA